MSASKFPSMAATYRVLKLWCASAVLLEPLGFVVLPAGARIKGNGWEVATTYVELSSLEGVSDEH